MAKLSKHRAAFIDGARQVFGENIMQMDRDEIQKVCDTIGVPWPQWLTSKEENRLARGIYTLQNIIGNGGAITNTQALAAKQSASSGVKMVSRRIKTAPAFKPTISATQHSAPTPGQSSVPVVSNTAVPVLVDSAQLSVETFEHASLVPEKMRGYVPFGHFNTLDEIVRSGIFYPAFVTGLSGNGKTLMLEQIAAMADREFIRVNITAETDEDDLIGGFRLQDGKTVWQNGPVVVAMERGAILLLDEVDLASNKIMCLQPVLEGKPIYLKKINKVVKPNKGFVVFATANTKGQGSMDGKFVGTNVLNEAFLERFPITIEQEYPSIKTEEKILLSALAIAFENRAVTLSEYLDTKAAEFVSRLVKWADGIRKTYADGACSEIISTRRLVHIVNAFVIFNQNRRKAIEMCLARFDRETKEQFVDLYTKIDPEIDQLLPPPPTPEEIAAREAAAAAETEKLAAAAKEALGPFQATEQAPASFTQQTKSAAAVADDIANEIENLLKAKGL